VSFGHPRATTIVVVLAVLLTSGPITEGGSGAYTTDADGGPATFDLSVSVRFRADETERETIIQRFEEANELLFDATEGRMALGTVTIYNNSGGGQWADIWIHRGSYTDNAAIKGLGGIHWWNWKKEGFRINHYWDTFSTKQ